MDVTSLRYMTSIHSQELETQRQLSAARSAEATEAAEKTVTPENPAGSGMESSFATALREEIAQLREEATTGTGGLEAGVFEAGTFGSSMLSGDMLGTESLKLGDLSEMMGSQSGRQAINAMAEASLNSLIFTGTTDNDQMNMLESLLQDNQSVQQEVADTLEQILNRLEEGNVISK